MSKFLLLAGLCMSISAHAVVATSTVKNVKIVGVSTSTTDTYSKKLIALKINVKDDSTLRGLDLCQIRFEDVERYGDGTIMQILNVANLAKSHRLTVDLLTYTELDNSRIGKTCIMNISPVLTLNDLQND